jgi:hypothetical protein
MLRESGVANGKVTGGRVEMDGLSRRLTLTSRLDGESFDNQHYSSVNTCYSSGNMPICGFSLILARGCTRCTVVFCERMKGAKNA